MKLEWKLYALIYELTQLAERPRRGFESGPHHTKGLKNGTSSSLVDARIKGM